MVTVMPGCLGYRGLTIAVIPPGNNAPILLQGHGMEVTGSNGNNAGKAVSTSNLSITVIPSQPPCHRFSGPGKRHCRQQWLLPRIRRCRHGGLTAAIESPGHHGCHFKAREWLLPAAMAITPVCAIDAGACPLLLSPQATTVPLFFRASEWLKPAAMAVTPLCEMVAGACPEVLLPRQPRCHHFSGPWNEKHRQPPQLRRCA